MYRHLIAEKFLKAFMQEELSAPKLDVRDRMCTCCVDVFKEKSNPEDPAVRPSAGLVELTHGNAWVHLFFGRFLRRCQVRVLDMGFEIIITIIDCPGADGACPYVLGIVGLLVTCRVFGAFEASGALFALFVFIPLSGEDDIIC